MGKTPDNNNNDNNTKDFKIAFPLKSLRIF